MSTPNANPLLNRSIKILLVMLLAVPLGLAGLSGCGEQSSTDQAGEAMEEAEDVAEDASENAEETLDQAAEETSNKS